MYEDLSQRRKGREGKNTALYYHLGASAPLREILRYFVAGHRTARRQIILKKCLTLT